MHLVHSANISKKPLKTFFSKAIKAIVGFFGVFLIFPFLIAKNCWDDNEWVWNKLEIEDGEDEDEAS